jgi:hypothetical protein
MIFFYHQRCFCVKLNCRAAGQRTAGSAASWQNSWLVFRSSEPGGDMPQLALIHTVTGLVQVFDPLVRRFMPGWNFFNIVDESLLKDTIIRGELTPLVRRRLTNLVWSAVDAGADAILVTCSSMGPAVDSAVPFCPVSLFRVDEAMADEAVAAGKRIAVVATLPTTLEPTRELIVRLAKLRGAEIEIDAFLVDGAFAALSSERRDLHDRLIVDAILAASEKADVIVLAQASMARTLSDMRLSKLDRRVLSSPELGIRKLKALLADR